MNKSQVEATIIYHLKELDKRLDWTTITTEERYNLLNAKSNVLIALATLHKQ